MRGFSSTVKNCQRYVYCREARMECVVIISVDKLVPSDRDAWEALFRSYIDFYQRIEPLEMYERAWREFQFDTRLHALGARLDGRLVGITHFFIHPSTSGPDVCYLQDLFTAPDARGKGVGRALIEAVSDWAREQGCRRVYWHTHESNATARRLYDSLAENRGFIRYQIELLG
jgi:GNAT superfamily N-acetyltransferase